MASLQKCRVEYLIWQKFEQSSGCLNTYLLPSARRVLSIKKDNFEPLPPLFVSTLILAGIPLHLCGQKGYIWVSPFPLPDCLNNT